jgi:NAD(P)-dependent dehydrogenase (short-subunit alcohol dehydrogenase family)
VGRVALVTGAGVRVGRAIALELAAAGCDVAVHHRRSAAAAREVCGQARDLGVRAEAVSADLASAASIEEMFGEIRRLFGRLDILVNSAAVFRRTPVDTLTEEDFDFHVSANLKGPYLCCIHAVRLMREAGGGSIVNIADVAAERPFASHVPYCVSKAGLVMLTRSLAKGLAPAIRVNAVAPGTVLFRDDETREQRDHVVRRIPLGRIGTPEDVARAVRFLCMEAPHVTGAVLPVDGGRGLD